MKKVCPCLWTNGAENPEPAPRPDSGKGGLWRELPLGPAPLSRLLGCGRRVLQGLREELNPERVTRQRKRVCAHGRLPRSGGNQRCVGRAAGRQLPVTEPGPGLEAGGLCSLGGRGHCTCVCLVY